MMPPISPDLREIEATPEMIEAGVARLFDYDPDFANEREIVASIFADMLSRYAPSGGGAL
jgi:hypothetical protein